MKKFAIIALCIAGISILFTLLKPAQKITNYPPQGDVIVMFGDSLVAGVGASKGGDLPSLLTAKIGQQVINMGIPGETTSKGLERLGSVLEQNPKVVIVLLGGNDFLQRIKMVETFQNLDSIVTQIQASGAVVVLLGIRGGLVSDPYEEEFEKIAKQRGALYVSDVLDGIFGYPELMSDSIHPNDAGYQKIADRIIPVLKKSFK